MEFTRARDTVCRITHDIHIKIFKNHQSILIITQKAREILIFQRRAYCCDELYTTEKINCNNNSWRILDDGNIANKPFRRYIVSFVGAVDSVGYSSRGV